jgi:hypothetical protein
MVEYELIDPVDTKVLAEVDRKMNQHNKFYARHILVKKGEIRK